MIICQDPKITLMKYEGILLWVIAYYRNYEAIESETDAFQYIMSRLPGASQLKMNKLLASKLLVNTLLEI